jgi:hypothetical protein
MTPTVWTRTKASSLRVGSHCAETVSIVRLSHTETVRPSKDITYRAQELYQKVQSIEYRSHELQYCRLFLLHHWGALDAADPVIAAASAAADLLVSPWTWSWSRI